MKVMMTQHPKLNDSKKIKDPQIDTDSGGMF